MMRHIQYPALALRATVAAALLATASLAHAEGGDAPDPAPAASDSPVRAVFSAEHPRRGRELWITDGTREGTQLLRDIGRGTSGGYPASSSPQHFSDLGDGRVAFSAFSHTNRLGRPTCEPWITDGTRLGTQLVRRIGMGNYVCPRHYTTLGDGRFVFTGRHPARGNKPCVWVSDGTRHETIPVVCSNWTSHIPYEFAPLREGQVVFGMNDGRRGWEPWITDGTREGTQLIRNLTRDDGSSTPREMTQLREGLVLFTARGQGSSVELWVTDGTRRGTRQLTEIPSSTVDNRPKYITPIGDGKALFSANFQLWITDGTLEGTHLLPDETTRVIPAAPSDFTALGDGRTLFTASTGSNNQLWITNGTARGTRIVREIDRAVRPRQLRALGDGRAVFLQWQGAPLSHYALWVTDGTRRGTSRVQQFPNLDYLGIDVHASLTSMGNGLALFAYDNGRTGVEPWVTDGTRAGTHLLRNIHRSDGSMRSTAGVGFTPVIPAEQ